MNEMMKKTQLNKAQGGFTLIELLIVVAIIGILAAIAVPQFIGYQQRAVDAACQQEVASLRTPFLLGELTEAELEAASPACEGATFVYVAPSASDEGSITITGLTGGTSNPIEITLGRLFGAGS